MSKRGYLSRYFLILKKLKANPYSSYDDLQRYLYTQLEYLKLNDEDIKAGFSKRTLQRDIREIRNVFGVDIEYSKAQKGYYISNNEAENMNFSRMMEAFELFSSVNLTNDLNPYIFFEQRKPQGTDNIFGLLHAIKTKQEIKFTYHKFWEEQAEDRAIQPFLLKEYRNRWYVLGLDKKDNKIKSFALDRLSELEITNIKFAASAIEETIGLYKHCFGIVGSEEKQPEDIVLSFTPFQGKYIKTLPLHASQKVLIDNEKELQVGLRLFISYDFVMELLSLGANVKVIKPQKLADELKKAYQSALNQY